MNIYVPDYYGSFSCIADKCKHNCCIGWEIDIDEETLEEYKKIKGEFGTRLADNIDFENPHFKLLENDRCPFLNKNNLCDIIKNIGEGKLCQICRDHPRFRNFFDSRTEMGLGLCCEEAGRIILNKKEKTVLVKITKDTQETTEEESFFAFRKSLFDILQNRSKALDDRIFEVIECFGLKYVQKAFSEWIELFMGLECLDIKWIELLKGAEFSKKPIVEELEIPYEQLIIYFLYRHLSEGFYDGRIRERILFAFLSYYIIRSLVKTNDISELTEISRMYSSEIEYCEENMETILKEL